MAGYPKGDQDRRVEVGCLQELVNRIFQSCKMRPVDAELLTDTLVSADLRGCHSHGVLRVPEYVKKLTVGGVDPRGEPSVVRSHAATLLVDGANSIGQIGCAFAMQQAIERAAETGVAVAAVRGSNHCGAMAYFAMLPLKHDMIGLATTNALPTMAPWGGCEKMIGINPLGLAVPADRMHPLVFDAAFSGSSHGKIRVYQQKGSRIPPDWALDKNGHPTDDPAVAIDGLLQPIGRYKGTGLAIMMGVLASVLSGACYGTELGDMVTGAKPGGDGQFLMAINVSAFEDPTHFKQRIDGVISQICASKPVEGAGKIYAPGGLEAENEEQHRRSGIPLDAVTIKALLDCARELNVDPGPVGSA